MPEYRIVWVPVTGANMAVLEEQHQRAFPDNQVAVVNGYAKVAVLEGEGAPEDALDELPVSPTVFNLGVK